MTKNRKKLQLFIIVTLAILLGGLSFDYFRKKNSQNSLTEVQEIQKREAEKIIKKLGHHIVLPTDEEPVIATVTDAEKLKQRSKFYDLARDGYKVILYKDRAILYDLGRDIIVSIIAVSYSEDKGEF